MKRKLFMTLSLFIMAVVANAELTNDTTIIVNKPSEVKISQSERALSVEVNGSENNSNYYYFTTLSSGDDAFRVEEEKYNEFNFRIPFMKNKERHYGYDNISMGAFGFGMVNAVNCAPGMNVDMGASYEFMISNLISWQYYPWKNGTALSIGLGFDWRNYRMTGKSQFIKDNENIIIGDYPDNADIKFSRIKVFSITVPFGFVQQINRDIKIAIEPVVNFNTYASLKTRYKIDGKKIKLVDKNIHQTPVTIDFMGSINFKSLGFYFKYSPSNVLNQDFGPKFSSMSAGLLFFY